MGSGCGSVGRAVAFDTRGPRFDSSHRKNFIEHLFIINCIEKTKINKKRLGMAHFKKKKTLRHTYDIVKHNGSPGLVIGEETRFLKVVVSYPSTVYRMYVFDIYLL